MVLSNKKTILVVEDASAVRLILCESLRRVGYRVLEAAHGEEALAVAAAHDVDLHLLLCDVVLPGMSGLALAEQVAVHHPGIRTIYMSGHDEDAIARYGLHVERVRYLGKPFTGATLTRCVREALRPGGARRTRSRPVLDS
jgi:CheY-like chemotaxis protein